LAVPLLLDAADTYLYANRIDEAIEKYHSIQAMAPGLATVNMNLGHAYEAMGMYKKAFEEYSLGLEQIDNTPIFLSELACACFLNGDAEKTEELYQSLIQRCDKEYISPIAIYSIHMIREDYDRAFEWLKKAIEQKDLFLLFMNICPTKGHRIPDEPRFRQLWKEAGLEI